VSAGTPIGVAMVGCGAISEWHRRALAQRPDLALRAAVDPDRARAEAVALETGAAPFASLDEALAAGGFEAVLLLVPHRLHEPLALRALDAGLHVLLEKPMAPSLDACERILGAAARSKRTFMVAENAQYWPEVRIARELIEAGAIGEVLTAEARLFFPPLPAYYGGTAPWRLDRAATGGGITIDTGSHSIRPLRLWLGEVEEGIAVMERPFARMEGESLVRALLRFRSGIVAGLDLLLHDGPLAPQDLFRITGRRGEITIGLGVKLYDAAHRGGVAVRPEEPQGYLLSYEHQLRDFARAVREGSPLEAGPEASLGELRAALALARSALSRRFERVWE
jgi:UDP-N-acetyl-2-amino-2-deoxyglucuronate dehydrogenase